MGQNVVCGRRGVGKNKSGGLRVTGMAGKPPPSGGGGLLGLCSRTKLSLQLSLGLSGAQQKIHKIKGNGGT